MFRVSRFQCLETRRVGNEKRQRESCLSVCLSNGNGRHQGPESVPRDGWVMLWPSVSVSREASPGITGPVSGGSLDAYPPRSQLCAAQARPRLKGAAYTAE